jgi:fructosamine-3-kinase
LSESWQARVASALGAPRTTGALGASAWQVDCLDRRLVVKTGAGVLDEASGLRLLDLARRCELAAGVERVVSRLEALLPDVGPALLHGDLWWGNVLWGADGRAWLIDPSVHGGHPEEDLAMLALFGAVPSRLLGAYLEERPLPAGWEERVDLFQLYPLLVHTVLFGGGYRGRAESVIRRYS